MRIAMGFVLILAAFILAALIDAQTKKDKTPMKASSQTILANLALPVKAEHFADKVKFSTFLEAVNDELRRQDRTVTISVDDDAFRDEAHRIGHLRFRISPEESTGESTLQYVLHKRQAIACEVGVCCSPGPSRYRAFVADEQRISVESNLPCGSQRPPTR